MIFYKDFDYNYIDELFKRDGIIEKKKYDRETNQSEMEYYFNTPMSFDTETTSYYIKPNGEIMMFDKRKTSDFYKKCKKQSLMYIWMLGIGDKIVYGRTNKDFFDFYTKLNSKFLIGTTIVKKIIYIHNLSFDFTTLINALGPDKFKVFAREKRAVMYAEDEYTQFRCSNFLVNMGLAKYCEEYHLPVQKKVGDLDYNVMRTPLTKLTDKELGYCEYDIKCVQEIIKYHLKEYDYIQNIPLTQTGKIRRKLNSIFYKDKEHKKNVLNMYPCNYFEYNQLCTVFSGGYTHSNYKNTNKVLDNVVSYDICSSYPFEMTTKKFPMTRFKEIDDIKSISEIEDFEDNYAYIIDFTVNDVKSKSSNSFLSVSKAVVHSQYDDETNPNCLTNGVIADNGRLREAKSVRYILTDLDFKIFKKAYSYSKIHINKFFIAQKDYLPAKLIQFILDLYKDKTTLKNVVGEEALYTEKKQMLNGCYGMFVTKLVSDDILFNTDKDTLWDVHTLKENDVTAKIDDILESNPVLSFAWGVWTAAYARTHLWRIILQIGDNMVYSDTDSNKFITDGLDYKKIFDNDTKQVIKDITAVCNHYKELKPIDYSPKDIKGIPHTIGIYEPDGEYKKFKTLGAKKYAYTYDDDYKYTFKVKDKKDIDEKLKDFKNKEITNNKVVIYDVNNEKINKINDILKDEISDIDKVDEVHITISGVRKSAGKYLNSIDDFKIGKVFNYTEADKLEHYYNDNQDKVVFPDGWKETSKYGICLKPTTYNLDITSEYENLISNIGAEILM